MAWPPPTGGRAAVAAGNATVAVTTATAAVDAHGQGLVTGSVCVGLACGCGVGHNNSQLERATDLRCRI